MQNIYSERKFHMFFLIVRNFKLNKKIFFWYLGIFIFLTLIYSLSLFIAHDGSNKMFISYFDVYEKFVGDPSKKIYKNKRYGLCLNNLFRYCSFGYLSLILIFLLVLTLSKRNISDQIQLGTISFWLTKKISRKNIIKAKIYSIFLIVFTFWLFMFIWFSILLLFSYDKDNYIFAILYMINYLFILALITSVIIFLDVILSFNIEWLDIISGFFIIYLLFSFACEILLKNKWLNSISILNIFPNTLVFSSVKLRQIIIVTDNENIKSWINVYKHNSFSIIHLCLGYFITIPLIYTSNWLAIKKFTKFEFNN